MVTPDERWMQAALDLAKEAAAKDEVPVGAVIVKDGQIIGRGHNLRETEQSPLKHAEIIAIEEAAKHLSSWRLLNCELYVTLEPCLMCAGAIYQARIQRVVFGTLDPKAGAMGSLYEVHKDERLNHAVSVTSGIKAEDCKKILQDFFKKKRLKNPADNKS